MICVLKHPDLNQCEAWALRRKNDGTLLLRLRDRDRPREFGDGFSLVVDKQEFPISVLEVERPRRGSIECELLAREL